MPNNFGDSQDDHPTKAPVPELRHSTMAEIDQVDDMISDRIMLVEQWFRARVSIALETPAEELGQRLCWGKLDGKWCLYVARDPQATALLSMPRDVRAKSHAAISRLVDGVDTSLREELARRRAHLALFHDLVESLGPDPETCADPRRG